MASYSTVMIVSASLGVALIVALLFQGVLGHQEEQALADYTSYLTKARQVTDAGQEPPSPQDVPLPRGYDMTLSGDWVVLEKGGKVIRKERYRRLRFRSKFDRRTTSPLFDSGDIRWNLGVLSGPYSNWCGRPGVVNETDYVSGNYDCGPREGMATAYLRDRSTLSSESLDVSGVDDAELTFWWRGRSFDGGAEKAKVLINSGGTATWHEVICMEDAAPPDTGCARVDDEKWHRERINITKYAEDYFNVRFVGSPGPYDDLWVDSVMLKGGW